MRSLLLALITLATTVSNAWAWGDTGHRVVCDLAFQLSSAETRAEIRRLIKTDAQFKSFPDSCIFPDHPRQRAPEHFINLARTSEGIDPGGHCPTASTCTLTGIEQDMAVLSSGSAKDADKLKSLKFLGHWVGDIHQPLHVSFEDDRGGNNIAVRGHCSTSLHSTWDTCLLQIAVGADVHAVATDLFNSITAAKKQEWSTTSPRDWANESFAI